MKTAYDMLQNKKREMVCVSPAQSVKEVVGVMMANKIGAILIKEEGRGLVLCQGEPLTGQHNQCTDEHTCGC